MKFQMIAFYLRSHENGELCMNLMTENEIEEGRGFVLGINSD